MGAEVDRDERDLADVNLVWGVRQEIVAAVGALAARPLDEHAVAEMQAALERSSRPAVRAALRRLTAALLAPPPPHVLVCGGVA